MPPLGIIGWASPLTAAGVLFPGTAWLGLVLCAVSGGALAARPRLAAAVLATFSVASNAIVSDAQPLPGWQAVDTLFGGIAHGSASPLRTYQTAEWIQREALDSKAEVIVFPETVVPTWTPATDEFWQPTLDQLQSSGKTILVGTRMPTASHSDASSLYDFSADLAALSGAVPRMVPGIDWKTHSTTGPPLAYDNGLILRGAQDGHFKQRIPVPIGMWNPLKKAAVSLNILSTGVIQVHDQRAAVLICHEQLLTWPVLASMVQRPTLLIAIANDYWAAGTPIPRFQLAAVRAWARLFHLPYLSAVNR